MDELLRDPGPAGADGAEGFGSLAAEFGDVGTAEPRVLLSPVLAGTVIRSLFPLTNKVTSPFCRQCSEFNK